MFKKLTLFGWLILLTAISAVCYAQNWKTTKFDRAWLPISSVQMKAQVERNSNDAVGLYYIWHQDEFQHQQQAFFSALEDLRRTQPKNGVLMAMRCAVIEDSVFKGVPPFQISAQEWSSVPLHRNNLETAKKLSPGLWLNYLTEAKLISWEQGSGVNPKVIQQQVQLCRKAVSKAPALSFTNNQLAGYLATLSHYNKASDAEAISLYRKAQQATPRICGPSFGLLFHYRFNKPNKIEAQKAQKSVLATIPPSIKLTAKQRQFLQKQGVSVPAGR